MESPEQLESKFLSPEELKLKEDAKSMKKLLQNERIRVSFERLQLSWIRTSLTMLAIGIGAFHYFKEREELGRATFLKLITGDKAGIFLVVLSFFMLLIATIQHIKSKDTQKKEYPDMRYSVATVLSYFIMLLTFSLVILTNFEL